MGAVIKAAPANAAAKKEDSSEEDSFDDEEPASKAAPVEAEGGVNTCATPSCSNWAVVFNPKNEAVAKKFVNNLKKVAPSLSLTMAAPKSHMLMDNRPETFIQKLNIVLNKRPQIIMVIIDNSEQYRAVKKCIKKPPPSQCVMSTVLNKQNKTKELMVTAKRVAAQMICKLGGEARAVDIPKKQGLA